MAENRLYTKINCLPSRWRWTPPSLQMALDPSLIDPSTSLQMALDPSLRKVFGFEMFASPFNAAVANGKFLSKYPHVEKHFGSLGR